MENPDGSHHSQASEQYRERPQYNPHPYRKPVSPPPPAPSAQGAFFAGAYNFGIHGGHFQQNAGDSVTNVSHDNSTNSDFNNQHGDSYENSDNGSTNFNGGYYDNQTHRSASYSANMNTYQADAQYSPLGRGRGRAGDKMGAHGWGGSGRGRSPELLPPARGADRRFHSAPAGIPQAQRLRGSPAHRPGITHGGRDDLNRPNQRFDHDYYPEEHEEYEEDYRDDQFYDAEWSPESTYPMEEYSQQQDHTESIPPSKTGAYKSNNPFAKFAAGTGS